MPVLNPNLNEICVTFKYDPFGRRIYESSSTGTSIFAYDGDNLVEETNSSGTAVCVKPGDMSNEVGRVKNDFESFLTWLQTPVRKRSSTL